MPFKMTAELNKVFNTCSEASLSSKDTHLVTLAAQLSRRQADPAISTFELARSSGASIEEINRVACLCACTGGARVQDAYVNLLRGTQETVDPEGGHPTPVPGEGRRTTGLAARVGIPSAVLPTVVPLKTHSLDTSLFRSLRLCSTQALDKKTTHLVGLAACLASGCVCAAGHIVEARNAGATDEELARCACIAACVGGMRNKFAFIDALQTAKGCKSCVC
jgi:alkylhydroperoxidase/carboxymuconolactone decarboxylase family protein YurZ